jgi:5-(carboxyamino)imidazole ribonucleotide synthase
MTKEILEIKIGVLGGGQLGKMLCLKAAEWDIKIHILDKINAPASKYCHSFTEGDYTNFEDVFHFGKDKDIITIEIEHVNVEALKALKKKGVQIYPDPEILEMIKDKGLQKQFYAAYKIPTAPFKIYATKAEILLDIEKGEIKYPFIQKSRTDGYDGKGVQYIASNLEHNTLLEGGSIVEKAIAIKKELAVIIVANQQGEIVSYPTVEMVFDHKANLLDYLIAPADISEKIDNKCQRIALKLAHLMQYRGILAVEFFLTKDNTILINEIAPRTHNSGHHTIDACNVSQFEMHLRSILNLPLIIPKLRKSAVMMNLVGENGYEGAAKLQGFETAIAMEEFYMHLYGKENTKPYRKMGHFTILDKNPKKALKKAFIIKELLKIKS